MMSAVPLEDSKPHGEILSLCSRDFCFGFLGATAAECLHTVEGIIEHLRWGSEDDAKEARSIEALPGQNRNGLFLEQLAGEGDVVDADAAEGTRS